jgi:hypothetical protein
MRAAVPINSCQQPTARQQRHWVGPQQDSWCRHEAVGEGGWGQSQAQQQLGSDQGLAGPGQHQLWGHVPEQYGGQAQAQQQLGSDQGLAGPKSRRFRWVFHKQGSWSGSCHQLLAGVNVGLII